MATVLPLLISKRDTPKPLAAMVDTSKFAGAVTVISVVRPVPGAVNYCTNGVTDALPKQADMLPIIPLAVINACAFANCILASSAINKVSFCKVVNKSVHFLMLFFFKYFAYSFKSKGGIIVLSAGRILQYLVSKCFLRINSGIYSKWISINARRTYQQLFFYFQPCKSCVDTNA